MTNGFGGLVPHYECACGKVYHMDCLEGLPHVPDGSVALTFTSPPYNIGKPYETVMDVGDYVDWCRRWLSEVHRATAGSGSLWLNVGYTEVPGRGLCVPIGYLLWGATDFYLLQEVVWHYGAGVACRKRLSPRNEKVLWYVKDRESYTFNLDDIRDPDVKYPNQRRNGRLRCNPLGKNPTDVWEIPKVTSGRNRSSRERVDHPAQTPLELVRRVVRAASNPGDLVMDPFMGSGTTAVACALEGRRFIGFEVDRGYCELAASRIARVAE